VSESVITYDGVPTYSVSATEFADDLVTHETQYSPTPSRRLPGGRRHPSRSRTATNKLRPGARTVTRTMEVQDA
jgi:hypothetical protein